MVVFVILIPSFKMSCRNKLVTPKSCTERGSQPISATLVLKFTILLIKLQMTFSVLAE